MDTKADIRRHIRSRRRRHVDAHGAMLWCGDWEPRLSHLFSNSTTIAAYVAAGSEANPTRLVEHARSLGRQIALPRVEDAPGALMTFRLRSDLHLLEPAAHGLLQPAASAPQVAPDLILLPLVAFDRHGNRLGQGGGYYDRALAELPHALRVGIAFAVQEVEDVPVEPWDMGLDIILTEREWIVP